MRSAVMHEIYCQICQKEITAKDNLSGDLMPIPGSQWIHKHCHKRQAEKSKLTD